MIVDLQFSAAHHDWPVLRDAVLQAEADGCGTTWVFDHFDGATLGGDREVLECFTLLGALASITSTIGLGTLVVNVANRHPAVTVAAASSVQRISGGRLTLGIGAGADPSTPWAKELHDRRIPMLATLEARHRAVVHQIDLLRSIAAMPIIVGVNSVALAQIAGRHGDGVNVRLSSPHAAKYLAAAREAAGDKVFDCSGWADDDDLASQEKAHELHLDRLVIQRFAL
jgi:alkanesulfonate monooxygenase SsuD/methylene tetrahydromethanopterin reductase-like flavin-dependent oxidoreductase (luciferase family)